MMIFVWAICSAGIAKSPPWPPDRQIRRERLAETTIGALNGFQSRLRVGAEADLRRRHVFAPHKALHRPSRLCISLPAFCEAAAGVPAGVGLRFGQGR